MMPKSRSGSQPASSKPGRLIAVLGPTNTGKTHFAMDRMLARGSGMIGFPLRLLARENYDRAVAVKGAHAVALITGEEKIVPGTASYFLCTVEAMPADRDVEFVGIDEVQLAADPERGHVFTDRILHARGSEETLFIGAETARPILRHLVSDAEVVTRPRFSKLTFAGAKQITRLPPRTAVIGFSAADVYALAELIRRRRGGTAVVLGALSPRTRNAQVAMYQAGDVDYLVATDAIGMGLNMDVDHVAFARLRKFDGRMLRHLTPAEIGQIAGRAGRHMNDGTFGTTGGEPGLDQDVIDAVENHTFDPLRQVMWRNAVLDYSSIGDLLASLSLPPDDPVLVPAREAEDYLALRTLSQDEAVRFAADRPARVALLWDVCQIPDFRKLSGDSHARLVGRIFRDLSGAGGKIDEDWMARHVGRLDKTSGDIGALVGRIADIRTWTYIAHRGDWLDDALHWQERTRQIEDTLSDALHDRLTERFVDKRTAALVRRLRAKEALIGAVNATGEVLVEGVRVGRLDGFRFTADRSAQGEDAKAIGQAANRALSGALLQRLEALEAALGQPGGKPLAVHDDGSLRWDGAVIGHLLPGPVPVRPMVAVDVADQMAASERDRLQRLLQGWTDRYLDRRLGALRQEKSGDWPGPVRGIVYQLGETLGCARRRDLDPLIRSLDKAGLKQLAKLGIRLGTESVYMPSLLALPVLRLRRTLWRVFQPADSPEAETSSLEAFAPTSKDVSDRTYLACGLIRCGRFALRPDRLELVAAEARKLARQGAFAPTPALAERAGCTVEDLPALLRGLGFHFQSDEQGGSFRRPKRGRGAAGGKANKPASRKRQHDKGPNPCSPFAVLRELTAKR